VIAPAVYRSPDPPPRPRPEAVPEPRPTLTVRPLTLHAANARIKAWHRHHTLVRGCHFCLGAYDEAGTLRGVAAIGRPTARGLQDGLTAEVTRLATDGCPNACSKLYQAAWRACREMGYGRLVSYILESEPGTSLRALKEAGWRLVAERTRGGSWDTPSRRRIDKHPTEPKQRWEVRAAWYRPETPMPVGNPHV
jgi:hypothetical protein